MCGIAGYYRLHGNDIDVLAFQRMLSVLRHRGPDDFGYAIFHADTQRSFFVSDLEGVHTHGRAPDVIMGHRRLSIIDLSSMGRQPMADATGNLWIVFNGEIYNYLELRQELTTYGCRFRTNTDTEVILYAYAHWGSVCLQHFNGMFSFALWDTAKQEIFCARDRAGVKPFYYVYDRNRFIFASEIKALLEMDIERTENHQVIYDYVSQGLLDHSDETFFRAVKQLKPAHYMKVSHKGLELHRWWDIEEQELSGLSDDEYAGRFEALFEDSIRLRLRSDVPVGTCLSGGLDSSSIVCVTNRLMSREGFSARIIGEKQRTFSSCFDDSTYDERPFIEEVTRQTGAQAHYVFPQGKDLFDQIAKVMWHQDEPFGSTSIFAQWHVMKLASENGIKVLLDGQGADELLAGYHGYFGSYYIELLRNLRLGRLTKELVRYRKIHGTHQPMIYAAVIRAMLPGPLIAALKRMPGMRSLAQRSALGTLWIDADFEREHRKEYAFSSKFSSALKNQLYTLFMYSSLPGLLHYEDRNSMAFSLEARVPFLDYRLIEYIFSLPSEQKLRSGMTKVVLRNAMEGILPERVRTRVDKMGFVTPETVWFRTILKDAVTALITSPAFRDLGYFDVHEVRREFDRHCRGEKNISFIIWRWINLLLWKDMFIRKRAN